MERLPTFLKRFTAGRTKPGVLLRLVPESPRVCDLSKILPS